MSMLLALPLELQLSIYEGSGNLHLKEVCQEIKEVFDTNLYGLDDLITKTNVKQKTISKISTDVVKKYSDDKELMTDLILRSLPQPKRIPVYLPFMYEFQEMDYIGMMRIRPIRFVDFFTDSPYYDIVKAQEKYNFDPIHLNDIESTIEKLIKVNDKETIMKLLGIHSDLTNKPPNYDKILNICASHNNFDLYKEFYTLNRGIRINTIFSYLSPKDDLYWFVKYENIPALEYFGITDKIIIISIKLNSRIVFDKYFDRIDIINTSFYIECIDNSIRYNNLYAFTKLISHKDCIKTLLGKKCFTKINNKEKETNYINAIRESCNCNKEFANFMDLMISKFLSFIVLQSIDINELLIVNQSTNSKIMYNPDIKFNKFKNVQYMKYQQRSHKNYNKQKFIKH